MPEEKIQAMYNTTVELSDQDQKILVYPDFELAYTGNGEEASFGIRAPGSTMWDRVAINDKGNFSFNNKTCKLEILEEDPEHGYVKFAIQLAKP